MPPTPPGLCGAAGACGWGNHAAASVNLKDWWLCLRTRQAITNHVFSCLCWMLSQRNCCLGQSGGSYLLNKTDKALVVQQRGCCRGTNNPSEVPAPGLLAGHPVPESCAKPAGPSIPDPWQIHTVLSGNRWVCLPLLEILQSSFFSFSYIHVLASHLGDQGVGLK